MNETAQQNVRERFPHERWPDAEEIEAGRSYVRIDPVTGEERTVEVVDVTRDGPGTIVQQLEQ